MVEQRLDTEEAARPQRRDAQENRQNLLAVAKQLFATQGVEATTMSEIARAAGVGQGTLYRHFADKSALCHSLIEEDLNAFQERIGALIGAAPGTPLDHLALLMAEKTRLVESHLPLFAAMDDVSPGGRHVKARPGPFYHWQHEQIVALLQAARAQGMIRPIDVPLAANAILAAIAPPLYAYQRQDLGYSNERIVANLQQIFVEGLRAQQ